MKTSNRISHSLRHTFKFPSIIIIASLMALSTMGTSCSGGLNGFAEEEETDDESSTQTLIDFAGAGDIAILSISDTADPDFELLTENANTSTSTDDLTESTENSESTEENSNTLPGTSLDYDNGFTLLTLETQQTGLNRSVAALKISDEIWLVEPFDENDAQLNILIKESQCPITDLTLNWVFANFSIGRETNDSIFLGDLAINEDDNSIAFNSGYNIQAQQFSLTQNAADFPDLSSNVTCNVSTGILTDGNEGRTYYFNENAVLIDIDNTSDVNNQWIFASTVTNVPESITNNFERFAGFAYSEAETDDNEKLKTIVANCNEQMCEILNIENVALSAGEEGNNENITALYTLEFDMDQTTNTLPNGFISGKIKNSNEDGQATDDIICNIDTNFDQQKILFMSCVGRAPGNTDRPLNLFITANPKPSAATPTPAPTT